MLHQGLVGAGHRAGAEPRDQFPYVSVQPAWQAGQQQLLTGVGKREGLDQTIQVLLRFHRAAEERVLSWFGTVDVGDEPFGILLSQNRGRHGVLIDHADALVRIPVPTQGPRGSVPTW